MSTRLCPRCQGSGEEVLHQPSIVEDPATITFTVCGRCHGDGTVPRMNLERAALEHSPENWFLRGVYMHCSCGYDPKDNGLMYAHWAFYGIKWVDNHGHLEWSRA